MWVYIYQNWTEKSLKNAYIGEYRVPWENTIAYYPLDTDFNDASGNGYNLTNNWAVIQTKAWVECAYFNWSSYATNSSAQNWTTRTLCAWVYIELSKTQDMWLICTWNTGDSFVGIWINQWKWYITDWWVHNENGTISVLNGWHLIWGVITNWWNMVLYTDGVQNASYTYSRQSWTSITLWARTWSWTEKLTWWMSRVIVENEWWTQQVFQNYYNSTKSDYGL